MMTSRQFFDEDIERLRFDSEPVPIEEGQLFLDDEAPPYNDPCLHEPYCGLYQPDEDKDN